MESPQRVTPRPGRPGLTAWAGRIWTPSQRAALCILLLVLSAVVVCRALSTSRIVPDDLPAAGPLADQVIDTLDPNTATAAELRLLPRVGQALADRIVQYRQEQVALHPGQPVFRRVEDLDAIRGIGPAMLEHLRPHLRFPQEMP